MRRLILAAALLSSVALAQSQRESYVDQSGRLTPVTPSTPLPTTGAPSSVVGSGLTTSISYAQSGGIAVTGPHNFFGSTVTLSTGQGPGFMMVFDAATVPPDGAVTPFRCFYVDAGPRTTAYATSGLAMGLTNGLAWAFSTGADCQTKQAAPASFVSVSYK